MENLTEKTQAEKVEEEKAFLQKCFDNAESKRFWLEKDILLFQAVSIAEAGHVLKDLNLL
jgi:hypothetical protein